MKHILFTLKGCPFDLLDDKEFVRIVLFRASKECKSTLLDLTGHALYFPFNFPLKKTFVNKFMVGFSI